MAGRIRIALSLLPGLPFLLAELLIPRSIPADLGLLLFAPVGEETLKLLVAFGLLNLAFAVAEWRSNARRVRLDLSRSFAILVFPFSAGLLFGVAEHFYTYSSEGPSLFFARIVTHIGFVIVGFGVCHVLWLRGAGTSRSVWLGLAFAALFHSTSNYFSLIR